jgi:signal transduction histidine kinase
LEYPILLPGGSKKILRGVGKIVMAKNGKTSKMVGTVQDVTEQLRQVKELEKALESDKLKSDFIKMASHELKTPVTSIKGFVQLLSTMINEAGEKELPPLMIKSSLVSIERQVNRLTRLMSELLDLSKLEAGQFELNLEEHSLNELMIDIVQDVLYTGPKQHINLYHEFECKISCDKDRLSQAVMNLLMNAIKYSPKADKVDVSISKHSNKMAAISIQDYGIGIDKKEHAKIFDRFYRAEGKTELTYQGFGIGLYIAREIIQMHGGNIEVKSEREKGSTFTFTIPFKG